LASSSATKQKSFITLTPGGSGKTLFASSLMLLPQMLKQQMFLESLTCKFNSFKLQVYTKH